MTIPHIYATLYPMAALGGLFVATIGVFLILGALLPTMRMKLTYVGFAAGTAALFLGGRLAVGPLIAVLGTLCLVNAAIAWHTFSYRIEAAWFLDGAMKLGVGILLITTSPIFT